MADDGQRDDYEEITLADLARTLYRRRIVLATVFVAALLVGVAFTVFTPKEYQTEATVVPLEHQDIIKNWLGSRQAAGYVVESLGDRVLVGLFPDRYDEATGSWDDGPPSALQAESKLLSAVQVKAASEFTIQGVERLVTVTVTLGDPTLARDVANAYLDGLETLRPLFENITRQEAFDRYYDGSNQEEANQRAEVTAKQREYWLVLDHAVAPGGPSSPNVTLNIALATVLGLLLGVFAVFFVEWVSKVRADARTVEAPAEAGPGDEEGGYTYRGASSRRR